MPMTGSSPPAAAPTPTPPMVGGTGQVDALTSTGMARVLPHSPARPAWLRPASPGLALQGVLAGHQARLARDTQLALDGQRRLPAAQARYATTVTGMLPEHLVAALTDRAQITELSASLVSTARQDWMTLENLATDMPLTRTSPPRRCPPPRARSGAGLSMPPP
jgi:hypothetical protein